MKNLKYLSTLLVLAGAISCGQEEIDGLENVSDDSQGEEISANEQALSSIQSSNYGASLKSITPAANATKVSTAKVIEIKFVGRLKTSSGAEITEKNVFNHIQVHHQVNSKPALFCAGTVAYDGTYTTVKIAPINKLEALQKFVITFKDLKNDFMHADVPFTTGDGANIYYANDKNGVKGDGITDDTNAIQTIMRRMSDGDTLKFPAGKYLIKGLTIKKEIHIAGDSNVNTIIKLDSSAIDGEAIKWETAWQGSSFAVTNELEKDTKSITFVSLGNCQPGDIVYIEGNKPVFSNSTVFKKGTAKRVQSINVTTKTVTLDSPLEYKFPRSEITQVVIYKGYNNISVRNLQIQLAPDARQYGIVAENSTNSSFENLRIVGGGVRGENELGLYVGRSIDSMVINPSCEGFLDASRGRGYGVQVSGNRVTVKNGTFTKCRHAIAAGDNKYICSGINYYNNTATQCVAAFDFHDNVINSLMYGNIVNQLGYYDDSAGIWDRGAYNTIQNNVISGILGKNTSGIKVLNQASPGTIVKNNRVIKARYGIKFDELVVTPYQFTITGNSVEAHAPFLLPKTGTIDVDDNTTKVINPW